MNRVTNCRKFHLNIFSFTVAKGGEWSQPVSQLKTNECISDIKILL